MSDVKIVQLKHDLTVKVARSAQKHANAFHNLATQIDDSATRDFNFAKELQWPSARYYLIRKDDPKRANSNNQNRIIRAISRTTRLFFEEINPEHGELVGGAGMWLTAGGIANISFIGVLPQYRKYGVGTLLLNTLTAQARQQGCNRITLELRQSNQTALNFYTNYGFIITGHIDNYYKCEGERAITMQIKIM